MKRRRFGMINNSNQYTEEKAMTDLRIRERIGRMMAELAEIGKDARGGYTRLAFSDRDWQVRDYLIAEMEKAGLSVRTDTFGNVFACTHAQSGLPAVLIGSHADSVPQGGNYDGIVGIVSAIAVAEAAQREEWTRPVEAVLFMAEESSRFGAANLGSKSLVGALSEDAGSRYRDGDGRSLGEVMAERGLAAKNVPYTGKVRAFLELHIEQGRVLEAAGCPLGIVTGIAAPHRYRLTIQGRADHSGATPMHLRADALAGAAEIIQQVEQRGKDLASEGIVATVGRIEAVPNVMNVIAGEVILFLDIRGTDKDVIEQACRNILSDAHGIAEHRRLKLTVDILAEEEPARLSAGLIGVWQTAADEIGEHTMRLASGAGHDALYMTRIAPVGMLFVPSKGGISHNPAEHTDLDDIIRGARVLYGVVRRLANE